MKGSTLHRWGRGRVWLLAAWALALVDAPVAADTAPAPKPTPFPFLAPPPLTSDTPEAPPTRIANPGLASPATPSAPTPAAFPAPPAPAPPPTPPSESNDLPLILPRPPQFLDAAGQPDELAAHLLVVYNLNDLESEGLARYYAQRRGILGGARAGAQLPGAGGNNAR